MAGALDAAEEEVLRYARLLYERGHVTLLSGNVSVRVGDVVILTPSSRPKPLLSRESLVWMSLDGSVVRGYLKPTSEWRMHIAIYRRRPDVGAVVHTHNVLPTLLAHRINLALLSESEAYLGSRVAVVPYFKPGSGELADAVASALEGCDVAVLRRHGVVAVGRDLADAVNKVEALADAALATLYDWLLRLACGRRARRARAACQSVAYVLTRRQRGITSSV
ncbi:MAG: class II aldolase/adducin family protein [Thermoproteaceae archaeon]|jgi:L-fuculose-phosphate aldolase|nr:class II aldolase/adducin family protein [Thermoproteaceae archaeon]